MPDYSMCAQKECPVANSCARFLAVPNPYRQSYFAPKFGTDGCKEYWSARDLDGVPFELQSYEKAVAGGEIMRQKMKEPRQSEIRPI